MPQTDSIADMLTRIRNTVRAKKEIVDIPASKLGEKILKIFKEDGYIEDFRFIKDTKQGILKVYLKYSDKKPAIIGIKKVSKPGLKVYAKQDAIPRVLNGLGTAIISTSKGVMTDREARKNKVGGEVLCYVW